MVSFKGVQQNKDAASSFQKGLMKVQGAAAAVIYVYIYVLLRTAAYGS